MVQQGDLSQGFSKPLAQRRKMMKRVMFVVVSLLLVGTCFAQLQSGPSNTVGYVKTDIPSGTQGTPTYKEFGLPFQFWDVPANNIPTYGVESRKPSDIIGTQANCGTITSADRIARQDGGLYAYRASTACNWTQSLETGATNMDPGRAYWYVNKSGAARTLVLAGQVNNSGNYTTVTCIAPTVANQSVFTPYSWRDSRDVPANQLNLLLDGFLGGALLSSDRIAAQTGGQFFWYRTSDGSWMIGTTPGIGTVTPGRSYWIQNRHLNHSFDYNYVATGVPLSGDDTHDLQVITQPATKKAAKSRVSTD